MWMWDCNAYFLPIRPRTGGPNLFTRMNIERER
jgi:hypothetical protein